MRHPHEHAGLVKVAIFDHFVDGIDRPRRHIARQQAFDPAVARVLAKAGGDQRDQGAAVRNPLGVGGKARVIGPGRPRKRNAKRRPELVVGYRDVEIAPVFGHERAIRHDLRVQIFGRAAHRHLAGVEINCRQLTQERERAIHQRHIDLLAAAGRGARDDRHQDAERGVGAGREINQIHPRPQRRAPGLSGHALQAADARNEQVVARPRAIAAAGIKRRHRAIDQARVETPQRRVVQPEALHHTGAEIFDHHVHRAHQLAHRLFARSIFKIERDAALVAVHAQKKHALAAQKRRAERAQLVAAMRLFDLDDVGAKVTQQHGAVGSGHHPREVEHTDTRERASVAHSARHQAALRVSAATIASNASAPRARACSGGNDANGNGTSTIGKPGMPSIAACFIPALRNPVVQSVTVAIPLRSNSTMSCTLHDTQDPQSPMAVTTAAQSTSWASTCGSQYLV